MNITVDWERFDKLNETRNEIEHYYTNSSVDTISEVISKSFILIQDFISKHLHEEPPKLLGDDCWQALLKIVEVYKAEETACRQSFEDIKFKNQYLQKVVELVRCPSCRSSLIKAKGTGDFTMFTSLNCGSCNKVFIFEEVMSECILECEHPSEFEEVDFAYCNFCQNTQIQSVIPTSDAWLCLDCLTTHEQAGNCDYCNELVAGELENSFMSGCLMCEGQMGHYMNSRAYNTYGN